MTGGDEDADAGTRVIVVVIRESDQHVAVNIYKSSLAARLALLERHMAYNYGI